MNNTYNIEYEDRGDDDSFERRYFVMKNKTVIAKALFIKSRMGTVLMHSVETRPEWRRKGIMFQLLTEALSWVKSLNMPLSGYVREYNNEAIALYEKLGLQVLRDHYYHHQYDWYLCFEKPQCFCDLDFLRQVVSGHEIELSLHMDNPSMLILSYPFFRYDLEYVLSFFGSNHEGIEPMWQVEYWRRIYYNIDYVLQNHSTR